MISFDDYKPADYDVPEKEYTFCIDKQIYQGFTYVYDKESPAFLMLDCGTNLISAYRQYYEKIYGITLPDVELYVINNANTNAFAVYEKTLESYCIGVFMGACNKIYENTFSSFEKANHLIPDGDKNEWLTLVYIEAIKFFVAHEYSHILAGHIDRDGDTASFEFADSKMRDHESNLFSQMKEFEADQLATQILFYMAHWNTTNKVQIMCAIERERFSEHFKDNPEPVFSIFSKENDRIYRNRLEKSKNDSILKHLKIIMAGINIVFYTFDDYRKEYFEKHSKEAGYPEEVISSFYYKSGLMTLREYDHPHPALRIDAVTRIMDECIEQFAPTDEIDSWYRQVVDYSWEVEIARNDYDLGKLYRHVAYTPTAQDFIQEMERLWEDKKDLFKPYIPQLVRLFYKNRLVHMTDNGELLP